MPTCPDCGADFPEGVLTCPRDGAELQAAGAAGYGAAGGSSRGPRPPGRRSARLHDAEATPPLSPVPELLLGEEAFSASDLTPVRRPAERPAVEVEVMVRHGEFLPPALPGPAAESPTLERLRA